MTRKHLSRRLPLIRYGSLIVVMVMAACRNPVGVIPEREVSHQMEAGGYASRIQSTSQSARLNQAQTSEAL